MNINLLITYYLHTTLRHAKYTPKIFFLRNDLSTQPVEYSGTNCPHVIRKEQLKQSRNK